MVEFPNPRLTTPEGLVAIGGELNVETLLAAYKKGIFPWPQADLPMLWFCPDPRGVLDFNEFHIPRSVEKILRKAQWAVTFNTAFSAVIAGCRAQPRPGQAGTWILPEMEKAYREFERAGNVLSVEVWEGTELVGGLYGVLSEKYFSAESMFYTRSNASKLALIAVVEELSRRGHNWMDIQMVTSASEAFGGKYISRDEFLRRIE